MNNPWLVTVYKEVSPIPVQGYDAAWCLKAEEMMFASVFFAGLKAFFLIIRFPPLVPLMKSVCRSSSSCCFGFMRLPPLVRQLFL